jgi:hypothetical protein
MDTFESAISLIYLVDHWIPKGIHLFQIMVGAETILGLTDEQVSVT